MNQEEEQPGLSRQSSNLTESNHQMMRVAIKKEDDSTTCKIWDVPWIELAEKYRDWVRYDIYDEYICPKCYDKRDISADDNFFVVFASDHKYHKRQISIRLFTRAFNYAMELSACIEWLLISIHWVKIFQLLFCVFTWNQPRTTQKFKLQIRGSFIRVVSFHEDLR